MGGPRPKEGGIITNFTLKKTKLFPPSPQWEKGGSGYFLPLMLAKRYLGLCLHMYKSSDLLFKVVFRLARAIVVFSTKHRSQCLAPGLKGTPLAFIDILRKICT